MELLKRILHSSARCADPPYLTGPGHPAAAAPQPPASLSAESVWQSYSANHDACHPGLGLVTHSVLRLAASLSTAPTCQ